MHCLIIKPQFITHESTTWLYYDYFAWSIIILHRIYAFSILENNNFMLINAVIGPSCYISRQCILINLAY